MDYYLYNPATYSVRAELKKGAKELGIDMTKKPWQYAWIDFLSKGLILPDIVTPIIFQENNWLKQPVCFLPETDVLIRQLLDTNYEGQVNSLRTYASAFSIAIPKSTKFNNQSIQGLFVTYLTPDEKNRLIDEFNRDYGTGVHGEQTGKTSKQLTITYADPAGKGRMVLNVDLWKLEWILSSETIEEFNELTGINTDSVINYELSTEEQKTQFQILKFVVSFIVYMSAYDECISEVHDVRMSGSDKHTNSVSVKTIKSFYEKGGIKPHYRNLRDDRFYQGKWSDWEKGSRWIPVNMETSKVS